MASPGHAAGAGPLALLSQLPPLLAPAAKTARLALARQLLAMSAANPQAREDAQAFMRRVAAIDVACCAHCGLGHCAWWTTARPIRRPLQRP